MQNGSAEDEPDWLRGLLEHSPMAIQVYRADGRCALVNPAFKKLLGEDPLDSYDLAESLPERPGTLGWGIQRAALGETLHLPADWYDLPSGRGSEPQEPRRVAAAVTIFPIRNKGSDRRGVVICFSDVTAERNLRSVADALELSRQQFRATFDQAAVGIAHVAPDGRWLNVNRRLCEIVGYTRQELLQLSFQDITHPEDLNGDLASVQRLLAGEIATYSMEKRYIRRDSTCIWAELTVSLVRDEAELPKYFISVVSDISARKAAEIAKTHALEAAQKEAHDRALAEARLSEAEEQLRHSQKMETIGRLAGTVAHDFNNLISVIGSYADLIVQSLKPGDPIQGDLQEIICAGTRASELTHQLLAFSRRQILQPSVTDLNHTISEMIKMLGRLVGEAVEVSFLPAADLPPISVDSGQLEQVLLNLVVNAKDAMPSGGKLTIETRAVEFDATIAVKPLQLNGGSYVMFSVTDTGLGIDKAVQDRIFEPFFTTKVRGKGTGLGLSTVFGIVKQSGGAVWIESALGKGTSFEIYLPRTTQQGEAPQPAKPQKSSSHGSETVLLSEDDDQVRALTSTILRRYGYNVLDARNGAEAIRFCEQHPGTIQLLLTDLVMPRMSGRELWEKISALRPAMRVLFMSGYADDDGGHLGLLPPGFSFIQKPLMPRPLLAKVRSILDGEQ